MTTWDAFAWFRIGITVLLAVVTIGFPAFVFMVLLFTHFPRLHFGKPKNPMRWQTHDAREILSQKDGTNREPVGRGHLLQDLSIRWWLGISSRNRAKWFLGLIRCDEH